MTRSALRLVRCAGTLAALALIVATVASAAEYTFPNQLPGTRFTVCGQLNATPWVYPSAGKPTKGTTYTYGVTGGFSCGKAAGLVRSVTAKKWDTRVSNAMLKGQPAGFQCFVSTDAAMHVWGGNCTTGPVGKKTGFGWIFGKR